MIISLLFFLFLLQNQVLKQNRDDDLRARMVLPSVNDPNVLVLQGVKKAARGNYSCRVGNGIPTHDYEVESEPIFLDVKCKYNLFDPIKTFWIDLLVRSGSIFDCFSSVLFSFKVENGAQCTKLT